MASSALPAVYSKCSSSNGNDNSQYRRNQNFYQNNNSSFGGKLNRQQQQTLLKRPKVNGRRNNSHLNSSFQQKNHRFNNNNFNLNLNSLNSLNSLNNLNKSGFTSLDSSILALPLPPPPPSSSTSALESEPILSYNTTRSSDIIVDVLPATSAFQILSFIKKHVVIDQFNILDRYDCTLDGERLNLDAAVLMQSGLIGSFEDYIKVTEPITLRLKVDHERGRIVFSMIGHPFSDEIKMVHSGGKVPLPATAPATALPSQQPLPNKKSPIQAQPKTQNQNQPNSKKLFTVNGNIIIVRGLTPSETPNQLLAFLKANSLIEAEYQLEQFDFYLAGVKFNGELPLLAQTAIAPEAACQPGKLLEIQLVVAAFLQQIKIIDIVAVDCDDEGEDGDNDDDDDCMIVNDNEDDSPKNASGEEETEEAVEEVDGQNGMLPNLLAVKRSSIRKLLPSCFSDDEDPEDSRSSNKVNGNDQPEDYSIKRRCSNSVVSLPFKDSQPRSSGNNNGGHQIQLWEFLLELLTNADYVSLIQWTGSDDQFKLLDPKGVARLWGERKNNQTMDYDKLSRVLRYYYKHGILEKVGGQNFCYKFVCDVKGITGYDSGQLSAMVQQSLMAKVMANSMANANATTLDQ